MEKCTDLTLSVLLLGQSLCLDVNAYLLKSMAGLLPNYRRVFSDGSSFGITVFDRVIHLDVFVCVFQFESLSVQLLWY